MCVCLCLCLCMHKMYNKIVISVAHLLSAADRRRDKFVGVATGCPIAWTLGSVSVSVSVDRARAQNYPSTPLHGRGCGSLRINRRRQRQRQHASMAIRAAPLCKQVQLPAQPTDPNCSAHLLDCFSQCSPLPAVAWLPRIAFHTFARGTGSWRGMRVAFFACWFWPGQASATGVKWLHDWHCVCISSQRIVNALALAVVV